MAESEAKEDGSDKPGKRTSLPFGPFAAIAVMYFTNSLAQTILFPFAAVMVRSFHVTDDPAKLGYYAGYLASSAFTGSLLSSSLWGALSDRIGRKPVLLIGLVTNLICAVLFGSSQTFAWAMSVRFINGLFSTILATGRSAVAELCDHTNQAQGFALIGTTFGAGLLIGPALGGFLSQPADKYPALFPGGSLFDHFPFLLPCLILACLTFLGLLSSFLFLPETLGRAKAAERDEERGSGREEEAPLAGAAADSDRWQQETGSLGLLGKGGGQREEDEESQADQRQRGTGRSIAKGQGSEAGQSSHGIREPLLGMEKGHRNGAADAWKAGGERRGWRGWLALCLKRERQQNAVGQPGETGNEGRKGGERSTKRFLQVLFARDTVVSTLIFCVLSFVSTSFNEVFPLWCVTPWELGGLSFDTNQIAIAQTTAGIALIPMQMYVYAPLVNRVGAVNALRTAVAVGVLLLLFPFVKSFGQGTVAMQGAIALFMALRSFPQCVFTSVFILISNSVEDPQYLGAINGLTQTLNMTFRAIAPTAGGSLFAWSTGQQGKFINANLWFYVIGLLYTIMLILTCFLSPFANERKFVTEGTEESRRDSTR